MKTTTKHKTLYNQIESTEEIVAFRYKVQDESLIHW